jgi:hypothetical protein
MLAEINTILTASTINDVVESMFAVVEEHCNKKFKSKRYLGRAG